MQRPSSTSTNFLSTNCNRGIAQRTYESAMSLKLPKFRSKPTSSKVSRVACRIWEERPYLEEVGDGIDGGGLVDARMTKLSSCVLQEIGRASCRERVYVLV